MSTETFSLFIMKASNQSLRQAEAYLRNRQWTIGSAVNMREALAYIIQKNPQYVMVCADHPNKKVKILPKLLIQAFPVKIIAFSEGTSPSSMVALREMNQAYTLYPPVSGPAIERMILKMKKDEEIEAERKKNNPADASNLNDGVSPDDENFIRLRGEVSAADAKSSFEQARAALTQLANAKDDEGFSPAYMPNGSPAPRASGGYYPQEQTPGSDGDSNAIYTPGSHPNDKTHEAHQQGPAEGETFDQWQERMSKSLAFKNQSQKPGEGGAYQNSGPQQSDEMSAKASTLDSKPIEYNPDGSPKNDDPSQIQSDPNASTWNSHRPSGTAHGDKQAPIMESQYVPKKKRHGALYMRGQAVEGTEQESLVVKGSVEALDKTVIARDDLDEEHVTKIENSSNVACITIDSPRFSGYLVAALGKNRKVDKAFIDSIKAKLFAYLKANGEIVSNEDSMGIKIKEVEFEAWAIEQAEFLRKSVHDGDEVAMAFFPHKDLAAKLEDSDSQKMVKMSVNELKEDVAVEFDLYMYMPANNKYLLYTPQGMPFAGKQKSNLQKKGITHMHLRRESVGEVKKYRAQNYLNEKIEAFKAAKKLKEGSNP